MATKVGSGFVGAVLPGVPVEPSPKHAPSLDQAQSSEKTAGSEQGEQTREAKVRHIRTLTSGVDMQTAMRLVAEFTEQYPMVQLEPGGAVGQAAQIREKFLTMQLGHDDMVKALSAGRETLANAMLRSGRVAPTPAHQTPPTAGGGGGFCTDCVVL
jgi:hypothetical protein